MDVNGVYEATKQLEDIHCGKSPIEYLKVSIISIVHHIPIKSIVGNPQLNI